MNNFAPAALAAAATVFAITGIRRLVERGGDLRRWVPAAGLLTTTASGSRVAGALTRAGIGMSLERFVLSVLGAAATVGLTTVQVIQSPIAAALLACVIPAVAWNVIATADRRYLTRFTAQLPVVAQQLGNAVGAGLSLRQAIARAAADAPEPAATELRGVVRELDLGLRTDAVLDNFAERLPAPGLRMMVVAIQVQRVVGGNLAAGLAALSARLEERAALDREVRSATAQARMSAWLVSGLPLVAGIVVEMVAPGTLARTLGHGPGLALVVAAASLQCVGVVLVRRIIGRDGADG